MTLTEKEIEGFVKENDWNDLIDESWPIEEVKYFQCEICHDDQFDFEEEVKDHIEAKHTKRELKIIIAKQRKGFFVTLENYNKPASERKNYADFEKEKEVKK